MKNMMTDMKTIKTCPRRRLVETPTGIHIFCNPMPIPKDLPYSQLVSNLALYTQKEVTIEDCEKCANKKLPKLHKRISNYLNALKDWKNAKYEVRTDAEVLQIWKICQQCEALDPDTGVCKECGCPIAIDGLPIKNKLKMVNTFCAKGLW